MHAFIQEIVEEDDNWAMVLTGRFRCSTGPGQEHAFDSLEEALTWARDWATMITVEVDGEHYGAAGDTRLPALPAAVAERAARGRRRLPGEEWRDRTTADPPIEWLVDLELHPGELEAEGPVREQQEAAVAAVAEALRAARYRDVEILPGELDEGLQDIEDQDPGTGDYGWTTGFSLAYRIGVQCAGRTLQEVVDATVEIAAAAVEPHTDRPVWRHTTDEAMYLGWTVSATARPVGAPPSRRWML